jgi:hypothetical protein
MPQRMSVDAGQRDLMADHPTRRERVASRVADRGKGTLRCLDLRLRDEQVDVRPRAVPGFTVGGVGEGRAFQEQCLDACLVERAEDRVQLTMREHLPRHCLAGGRAQSLAERRSRRSL